ncbi:MAG: hypothetical protein Q8878_07575 [Bacillota bacterium]|nr:hypothetical protein [Bacillota bacterium]
MKKLMSWLENIKTKIWITIFAVSVIAAVLTTAEGLLFPSLFPKALILISLYFLISKWEARNR